MNVGKKRLEREGLIKYFCSKCSSNKTNFLLSSVYIPLPIKNSNYVQHWHTKLFNCLKVVNLTFFSCVPVLGPFSASRHFLDLFQIWHYFIQSEFIQNFFHFFLAIVLLFSPVLHNDLIRVLLRWTHSLGKVPYQFFTLTREDIFFPTLNHVMVLSINSFLRFWVKLFLFFF